MKLSDLSLIVAKIQWKTNAATQFLVVRAKSFKHLPALMSLTDMIFIVGRSIMKISFLKSWQLARELASFR